MTLIGGRFHIRPGVAGNADDAMYVHTFQWGTNAPPPDMPAPTTVLDLGAHVGFASALYRELWPGARILAVEMDAESAMLARRNADVEVLCAAVVGRAEGRLRPYKAEGVLPPSYELAGGGDRLAAAVTLPELVEYMGGVDYVKMDVEGAEFGIIAQASEWAPLVGNLLIEFHGVPDVSLTVLESHGYRTRQHPNHDRSWWVTR